MMGKPLVSVIVPIYNAMPYLEPCIHSIIVQTYDNIEILLVDDGSTDGSGVFCDELEARDARITAIHTNNCGVGSARNRALEVARGEWLIFVDSDDIVESWHVETLLSEAQGSNAEIALGGYRLLESDGLGQLLTPSSEQSPVSARRAIEMLMYQEGIDTAPWGKLFRADTFAKVRFPSLPSSEDLATVYKTLLKSSKVAIVRDSGYRYRATTGSLSASKLEEDAWDVARRASEGILKIYPDLERACCCRRLSFAFHVMTQTQNSLVLDELWREVITTRGVVLRDKRARGEARSAALVSFAGRDIALAIAKQRIKSKGLNR